MGHGPYVCEELAAATDVSFGLGRGIYVKDVREKMETGSTRLKKRSKTIRKNESAGVKSSLKGTFMDIAEYKKEF